MTWNVSLVRIQISILSLVIFRFVYFLFTSKKLDVNGNTRSLVTHIQKMTLSQFMGIAQRKEREKERRRAMILEAAEQLIIEKGHENLNMDEVAERAEVSKGTLYLYFNSKTDLIMGIVMKASKLLNEKFAEVLTKDLPGIELVREIGWAFLDFVTSHPEFFGAMKFYENLKNREELEESENVVMCQEYAHKSFSYTVRAIQIGMQDGTIDRNYDPKQLAVLIWASSKGMVNMAYMQNSSQHLVFLKEMGIEIKDLFDEFMKLIGCGIAAKEPEKNK